MKPYHELIAGRIFFGGAQDIQQMVDEDQIALVVDLRAESTGCAASQPDLKWVQIPLGDNAEHPEDKLFRDAIGAVVDAYQQGQKAEAEAMAKSIRPVIKIKPDQYQALSRLYPEVS